MRWVVTRLFFIFMLAITLSSCGNGSFTGKVFYLSGTGEDDNRLLSDLVARDDPGPAFDIILPEDGASYPLNFAPPEFEWERGDGELFAAIVKFPDGHNLTVFTRDSMWRPSPEHWDIVKDKTIGQYSEFTVYSVKPDRVRISETVRFRVSPHKVDQYIVYRLANYSLQFNQIPVLYYRDISTSEPEVFFEATDCTGCHMFSKDETKMFISTRKEGGTVGGVDIITAGGEGAEGEGKYIEIVEDEGSRNIRGSHIGAWHPDGDKAIISYVRPEERVQGMNINVTRDFPFEVEIHESYRGDIAVYDLKKGKLYLLPGASTPRLKEFFPDVSPDGKTVAFTTHTASDENIIYNEDADIYYVPFNDGRGGEAKPMPGASDKAYREYSSRFSPDGKWIIFNRAEGMGDAFLENTSLYIMPAIGGTPRLLEASSSSMDTTVIWSGDSRWIAFVSRRYNQESRIYYSEITDDGHAYPAVKMPNSEGMQGFAYHHPYLVKDKRSFMMFMKTYNRFFSIE